MDETPNNIYSILLEKNMKMSRGEKSLKVINEIHPPIKGNRILVPGLLFKYYSSDGNVRLCQKSKHGFNSYIPMLDTLKGPELAELNFKGNKCLMDPLQYISLYEIPIIKWILERQNKEKNIKSGKLRVMWACYWYQLCVSLPPCPIYLNL